MSDAPPRSLTASDPSQPTANVHGPVAKRHLLVALPHPDDESFAAGGTIAMHADAGVPVTYLCGTFGDMGRNMGTPFFANRESMRDVREAELREACRILGCTVELLGLRDKTVEFEDEAELAERIGRTIERTGADLVIGFYPGHAVHPDHDAMGAAVARAVRSRPEGQRPTLWAVAVTPDEDGDPAIGMPDVVVDVTAFGDRKLQALRAHASQTSVMFDRLDAALAAHEKVDEGTRRLRERVERSRTRERFYRLS